MTMLLGHIGHKGLQCFGGNMIGRRLGFGGVECRVCGFEFRLKGLGWLASQEPRPSKTEQPLNSVV